MSDVKFYSELSLLGLTPDSSPETRKRVSGEGSTAPLAFPPLLSGFWLRRGG